MNTISANITAKETVKVNIGGGGVESFVDLGDVPASYVGAGGKIVKVKADVSGLEFVAGESGVASFNDLDDVPASYAGAGGKIVKVKADVSGLEFVVGGGGVASFNDLDDVPASYAGAGGKIVKVKADASGLEFVAGGENMVYTAAAAHTHTGNNTYQTVLNIAATHYGQAMVFMQMDPAESIGTHYLRVTVDGVVVVTDLLMLLKTGLGVFFGGIYNFNSSLLIEHKSEKQPICRVAYCSI
jgi:hypothetical protein